MNLAWALSVLALACAAWRIVSLRLVTRYPFLFAYLVLNVVSAAVLWMCGSPRSPAYLLGWEFFEPFRLASLLLAVAELYFALAGHFPRIGRVSTVVLSVATAMAVVVCLGTVAPELGSSIWAPQVAHGMMLAHRWLATISFIMLWCAMCFFGIYARRYSPNVRRQLSIMLVYLGSHAIAFAAVNVWPATMVHPAALAQLLVSAGCGIAWTLCLTRAGEQVDESDPVSLLDLERVRQKQNGVLDEIGRIRPLS